VPAPVRTRTDGEETMTDHDLTPEQEFLLVWLGNEAFSQYGECFGARLDALIAKGLAQIHTDRALQAGFIAQGDSAMYLAVSLTEAGWAARRHVKENES